LEPTNPVPQLTSFIAGDPFEERPLSLESALAATQGKLEEAEQRRGKRFSLTPSDGRGEAGDRDEAYAELAEIPGRAWRPQGGWSSFAGGGRIRESETADRLHEARHCSSAP